MLSKLALSVSLASIFLCGQSIELEAPSQLPFIQHDVHRKVLKEGDGPVRSMGTAPPHFGQRIPHDERATWYVYCSSELNNHECDKIKERSNTTFWQTKVDAQSVDPLPHTLTIDLRGSKNVNAVSMRPLPDADLGGAVAGHKLYLSRDGKKWDLVAFGTWFEDVQGKPLVIAYLVPVHIN